MARVHTHTPFGDDKFGAAAERFARFFGTSKFLLGQTLFVAVWIAVNGFLGHVAWDVYPFILLNLMFSTQAAYAAPLILLAQTRQAERDKAQAELDSQHRQEIADQHTKLLQLTQSLLEANTVITNEVHTLATELHNHIIGEQDESAGKAE